MSKYEKGKIITGCVTGIENYGIFVTLDEYYSGLIHISEISNNFVRNISDYVNVGETIKAKVVDIDDENCHVKLSIKDIDYRINNQKRTKIIETNEGFIPLKNNLDKWIDNKLTEINQKNNN
jgi:general stress protein 13